MSEGKMVHIDRVLGVFYSEGKIHFQNTTYTLTVPIGFVRYVERDFDIKLDKVNISLEYCKETLGSRILYQCAKCGAKVWSGEILSHLEGEGVITTIARDDGWNGPAFIYRPQVPKIEKVN